jgi:hypothetical protein
VSRSARGSRPQSSSLTTPERRDQRSERRDQRAETRKRRQERDYKSASDYKTRQWAIFASRYPYVTLITPLRNPCNSICDSFVPPVCIQLANVLLACVLCKLSSAVQALPLQRAELEHLETVCAGTGRVVEAQAYLSHLTWEALQCKLRELDETQQALHRGGLAGEGPLLATCSISMLLIPCAV